jgi:hypothetical protein
MGCSLATPISPDLKPQLSHSKLPSSSQFKVTPISAEEVTSIRNAKRLKEPEVIHYPASFLEIDQGPEYFSNPARRPPQGITPVPASPSLIDKDGTSN